MNNETFRNIRIYLGLTQKEYGEKIGLARQSVSLIELGERVVTNRVRMRVAQVFNLDEEFIESMSRYNKLSDL